MMAYPMGLPTWDTVKLTIESVDGLDGTSAGAEVLDSDKAELWVATKFFDRTQTGFSFFLSFFCLFFVFTNTKQTFYNFNLDFSRT